MIEEIQKSIQLINFNDSIFDQNTNKVEEVLDDDENIMLKGHQEKEGFVKYVKYEDLLKAFIRNNCVLEMAKVLVSYRPLLKIGKDSFSDLIERERKIHAAIEEQCFGRVFCNEKAVELYEYSQKLFAIYENINEIFPVVLMKRIPSSYSMFDVKKVVSCYGLIEARLYVQLNFEDFYKQSTALEFIELFNKFTNFLISEVLKPAKAEERRKVVKKILKLAHKFALIGAMNSLKSCMAALECNSVHRLHVIKDQGSKYQKRFKMLSQLTSAEGNFAEMREATCLVPWLGILLRDFAFIKETHKQREGIVNVPLGLCLVKLMNSMTEAREVCVNFVKEAKGEDVKQAAIMESWLRGCVIEYSDEESQYQRSKHITDLL